MENYENPLYKGNGHKNGLQNMSQLMGEEHGEG